MTEVPRSLHDNVLTHAGKSGRRVVSAFIATPFAQETPGAASTQWRAVADQIRPKVPKLATLARCACGLLGEELGPSQGWCERRHGRGQPNIQER
ncbi:hypothetical protein [Mesorhizobium sp. M1348]|uniref:hypothetical protein n=1 Tax=Mesorhizobium sp. M1348 TaxID=2957089 RepID=UPI003337C466